MIDETDNTPGWSGTPFPADGAAAPDAPAGSTPPTPTAFCQDCGTPLSAESTHRVGASVFCEPCLVRRTAAAGSYAAPRVAASVDPLISGEPKPAIAALLGFIPGVGAIYNGQVAKGFAHMIIFAILMAFANHVSDTFSIFVAGWVFYQVFDALYTARARRDGLPLPDFLNLNNIGEHLQARQGWTPGSAPAPPTPSAQPQPAATWSAPMAAPPAPVATPWSAVPPAPVAPAYDPANPSHQANWAGYIAPTAFTGNAPYRAPQPAAAAGSYAPTFTGYVAPPAMEAVTPAAASGRRFPTAAIILIVLGVFFLLVNLVPSFHVTGRWVPALVLLGATVYSLFRRVAMAESIRSTSGMSGGYTTLHIFRIPLILATLTLLFVLQAADIRSIGHTWGLLLIVAGVLAFADRALQPSLPPAAAWNAAGTAPAPTVAASAPTAPTEPAAPTETTSTEVNHE